MNFIAQGAALYSANPINSILEDQIECARAHSRGAVDYDKIVRGSLYSDCKSNRSGSPPPQQSSKIKGGAVQFNSNQDLGAHATSQASPNRILTSEKGFNRIMRNDIKTAG